MPQKQEELEQTKWETLGEQLRNFLLEAREKVRLQIWDKIWRERCKKDVEEHFKKATALIENVLVLLEQAKVEEREKGSEGSWVVFQTVQDVLKGIRKDVLEAPIPDSFNLDIIVEMINTLTGFVRGVDLLYEEKRHIFVKYPQLEQPLQELIKFLTKIYREFLPDCWRKVYAEESLAEDEIREGMSALLADYLDEYFLGSEEGWALLKQLKGDVYNAWGKQLRVAFYFFIPTLSNFLPDYIKKVFFETARIKWEREVTKQVLGLEALFMRMLHSFIRNILFVHGAVNLLATYRMPTAHLEEEMRKLVGKLEDGMQMRVRGIQIKHLLTSLAGRDLLQEVDTALENLRSQLGGEADVKHLWKTVFQHAASKVHTALRGLKKYIENSGVAELSQPNLENVLIKLMWEALKQSFELQSQALLDETYKRTFEDELRKLVENRSVDATLVRDLVMFVDKKWKELYQKLWREVEKAVNRVISPFPVDMMDWYVEWGRIKVDDDTKKTLILERTWQNFINGLKGNIADYIPKIQNGFIVFATIHPKDSALLGTKVDSNSKSCFLTDIGAFGIPSIVFSTNSGVLFIFEAPPSYLDLNKNAEKRVVENTEVLFHPLDPEVVRNQISNFHTLSRALFKVSNGEMQIPNSHQFHKMSFFFMHNVPFFEIAAQLLRESYNWQNVGNTEWLYRPLERVGDQ